MQREAIINELERMGAKVECSAYFGGVCITYAGVDVDVQIEDHEIPHHESCKFARLDTVEDAQGLINSIWEHRA